MKTAFAIIDKLLLLALLAPAAPAQKEEDAPALARSHYRSGQAVLNAFAPVSAQTSNSIVEINVNEDTVALGVVVEADGLVLTKASEIKTGKLTCWLPSGKEVEAQWLASDEEADVALVRVKTDGLKPIEWATNPVAEGQWAITPGLSDTPQAIGIISALPRKIEAERALIGVMWNRRTNVLTVDFVMPGFGAAKAGMKRGDIIRSINGTFVMTTDQVTDLLHEFHEGQTVHIGFQRAEKKLEADIKLLAHDPSEDVSARSVGFAEAIEHDTVLEPWQCGGPLVNLDGKAIGLNIARASRFATYALPASLTRQIMAKLKAKAEKP